MKKIKKAIFPVAGLGTRFLPATKSMPKEMLTLIDRPLIQYAVEEAKNSGIEEFIFVTGRGKSSLEDFFDYSYELNATLTRRNQFNELEIVNQVVLDPGHVVYTRQQEPLGLGHAVWCARNLIQNEPFAVILADDLILSFTPCLQQMISTYEKKGGNILAIMDVPAHKTSSYGIIEGHSIETNLINITGLVEKPINGTAPSNQAIIGRYILQPNIFEHLTNLFSKGTANDKSVEIHLTDAMAELLKIFPFYGLKFQGRRFDCGSPTGLLAATLAFSLERRDIQNDTDIILNELGYSKKI